MKKQCKVCEEEFEAKHKNKTLCSEKCQKEARRITVKKYDDSGKREEYENSDKRKTRKKEYLKQYRTDNQKEIAEYRWAKWGIKDMTVEKYESMVEEQNNNCGICGKKTKIMLCVDHNHRTGEARGLLCNECNQGLGYFKDKIDILASAISYLQQE